MYGGQHGFFNYDTKYNGNSRLRVTERETSLVIWCYAALGAYRAVVSMHFYLSRGLIGCLVLLRTMLGLGSCGVCSRQLGSRRIRCSFQHSNYAGADSLIQ